MNIALEQMKQYLKKKSASARMWERINLVERITDLLILPNMANMEQAKECFDRLYLMVQAETELIKR